MPRTKKSKKLVKKKKAPKGLSELELQQSVARALLGIIAISIFIIFFLA